MVTVKEEIALLKASGKWHSCSPVIKGLFKKRLIEERYKQGKKEVIEDLEKEYGRIADEKYFWYRVLLKKLRQKHLGEKEE